MGGIHGDAGPSRYLYKGLIRSLRKARSQTGSWFRDHPERFRRIVNSAPAMNLQMTFHGQKH